MSVELADGVGCGAEEVFGNLFDEDEVASDEGAEGAVGDGEVADICDAHATADGGDFGEEVGLVGVELREAGFGNEDGDAFEAAGATFFGDGFADEPLFFDHAVEEGFVGLGGRAEGGGLGDGSIFEIVEDGVLAILIFRGETRAAGRAFFGSLIEDFAARFGDAIDEVTLDLGSEGEHAAKDFAERSDVVLGDPGGEAHEFIGQDRCVVEDLLDGFGFNAFGERIVVKTGDDAHKPLAAEGNEDAGSDDRNHTVDCVGEGLVEGDGQGDIAEGRHLP